MNVVLNDEMFTFLTEPEKFLHATKLYQYLSLVQERLLKEFWKEVEEKIREEIILHPGWIVNMREYLSAKKSVEILVYNDQWLFREDYPFVCIGWAKLSENPYYGVWHIWDGKENTQQVSAWFWPVNRQLQLGFTEGVYWPLYSYADIDFSRPENWHELLPEARAGRVEDYSNKIIQLIKNLIDADINDFMNSVKETK